jgi:predicted transcriptional regulator
MNNFNIELNQDIVKEFQQFLKIKSHENPTKTALKRYNFLYNEIISNRYLTKKSYQFCTTKLATKYDSHHSTVGKWLKSLIRMGILKLTNGKWHKGEFSKRYTLQAGILEVINRFNGFNEKFKKAVKKKIDRSKKLRQFDAITYSMSNATFLATGWLGCPKQFADMIKKKVPKEVLQAPREWDIREPRFWDFFESYNSVAKNNKGYKKIKSKEWLEWFSDYQITYDSKFRKDFYTSEQLKEYVLPMKKLLKRNKLLYFRDKKRFSEVEKCLNLAFSFLKGNKEIETEYVAIGRLEYYRG